MIRVFEDRRHICVVGLVYRIPYDNRRCSVRKLPPQRYLMQKGSSVFKCRDNTSAAFIIELFGKKKCLMVNIIYLCKNNMINGIASSNPINNGAKGRNYLHALELRNSSDGKAQGNHCGRQGLSVASRSTG